MYKNNFRKNKKLVRTMTISIAILITATLIFSGAVSAIGILSNSTKMNIKGENNVLSRTSREDVVNPELSLANELEFPTNPSPTGVSLLTEGFEGSWPGNWTLIQTNPGPGVEPIPPYWSQTDYDQHSGTYAAGLWWDYAHQDEWLISPDIELTGAAPGDEYYVTFWTYGWEGSVYDDHYYVKVSTDNGTTWTPIFDLSDLTGGDWNAWDYPYTIDLTAYADETVNLAWHAIDCNDPGNPNYPGLWYVWIIDDIEVGYTTLPDHDVGVTDIISPPDGTSPAAEFITPQVEVENFGLNTETVDVTMQINKLTTPTTILSEDFEGYQPAFPPPGWTVYNLDGGDQWIRYSSYPHTGTYHARCYYDSANDDWLVTKGVVQPASPGNFELYLSSYLYANELFEIYYSTTGNTPADFLAGTLLLAGTEPSVAPTYSFYTFPIPASTGTTVWYAVRYVGLYDWALFADDFIFPDGTTEGFEGADWLPAGWTEEIVVDGSTSPNWDFVSSESHYPSSATPHGGTYMAEFNSYSASTGTKARLYTPAINLAGYTAAYTTFWMNHDTYGGSDQIIVQGSSDGTNWDDLETFVRNDGNSGWTEHTVGLNAYAGGTCYVGFLGVSAYGYDLHIDDVSVEIPGVILEVDLQETITIDPEETQVVTFSDWTPSDWQVSGNADIDYIADACTELPGDEDDTNDCQSKMFTLHYPYMHDIELTSINSPTGRGPAQTQDVEVTIKNVGQFPESPPNAYSGDGLWATVPHGDYTNAGGSSFLSKTIDLTGVTDAEISFYEWHDVFGSFDWIAVNVNGVQEWFHDSSTPSTSWQLVTIDLDDYGGQSNVEIVFELYATTVVERAGWYIDDVTILDVETVFTLEYDEDICTILLDPGEEAVLEFPDWTPDGLSNYSFSGTIAYDVTATALATGDTNPANDQATAAITLDYFHDVGVKDITQPSMSGTRAEEWIYYDDGVYYDAIGLTYGGTFYGGIRFTPTELAGYDGWSLSKAQFYWNDNGVGPDTGVLHIYDEGTESSPGPELTSEPYTVNTDGWKVVDLSIPVTIDASKDIWVVFEITHVTGGYPLSVDNGPQVAGKSQWISTDGTTWDELTDLNVAWTWNWMMRGFVIETEGPPPVEVYVASGTSPPIEAIVENLGTFTETDLTCYAKLYEYITDPLNGTLVHEDNETGISLNPLGDQQTVGFDSYNFVDQGVYGLEIDFPLGIDGYTDNNHKRLGIGCDGTKPTSTHTLDPADPDGLNGWYVSDVEVILDADDGTEDWQSGVKEIKYRINGGTTQTISGDHGSFMLTDDGDDILVEYWAVDNVENTESTNQFTIDMDQTDPEIDAAWDSYQEGGRWYVRFTITATDVMSGMERVDMWINLGIHETITGAGPTYEFVIQWSGVFKTVTFKFVAYDIAGHSDYDEILGSSITAYPYPSGSMTITQNTLKQTMPMQR